MNRFFTQLAIIAIAVLFVNGAWAQCSDYNYYIPKENIKWTSSDYYKVLEFKGSDMTDASLPKTGATDGKFDNIDWSGGQAIRSPYGSGVVRTPLYTFDQASSSFVVSDKTWPVTYHNCVFAAEHYGSAYTKMSPDYGETPSGKNNACTLNDNTVYVSKVFDMKGFVEMNRFGKKVQGDDTIGLGCIQIDGLHHIERIQWGYSSTAWKRGVKCDIRYEGENWKPLRWIPSDIGGGNWTPFSEQGYELEETLDPESDVKFSVRWRPWDGDTLTFKPKSWYEEKGDTVPSDHFWKAIDSTGTYQVARIHMIRIYAGIDGLEFATGKANLALQNEISIRKIRNEIVLSKEARIEVYNLSGSLILSGKGRKLAIEGIRKGQYIIRAIADDGSRKNIKMAL